MQLHSIALVFISQNDNNLVIYASIKLNIFKFNHNFVKLSDLIAALRKEEQPSTRILAAPNASVSFCMSSSSPT